MRARLVGGPLDGQERTLSEMQQFIEESDDKGELLRYRLSPWTKHRDESKQTTVTEGMYVHDDLSEAEAAKLVLERRKRDSGADS